MSNRWMQRHIRDIYVRKAQSDNYSSRAAYKLQELQLKHRFLRTGMVVVDTGAAPGGWTQAALEHIRDDNDSGLVIAVDVHPLNIKSKGVVFVQKDFTLPTTQKLIRDIARSYHELQHHECTSTLIEDSTGITDVVLSDMAPSNKRLDRLRAAELATCAYDFAQTVLRPGGTFLCKGPESDQLRIALQRQFDYVSYEKPNSSRSESAEGYLLARNFQRV